MRTEQEIFEELAVLCASPGYIHVIAYFCTRDSMIKYENEVKPEDMLKLHDGSRLIRTETSALLGLLVKNDIDYSIPEPALLQQYADKTATLLEEIHASMSGDFWTELKPELVKDPNYNPFTNGAVLRETIFYGSESAYGFQYRDFCPLKYGRDDEWLVANKGYSVHDGRKVVLAVGKIQNEKPIQNLESLRHVHPDHWTYLPGHEFTAAEVAGRSNLSIEVVERVLAAFTLPQDERNTGYQHLQDFNATDAFPLLRRGETYTLFNINSLSEAFYQSPFYWMWEDKSYRSTAMEHRGQFTEEFSAERLTLVFGKENVHSNVNIVAPNGDIRGEIDVLVLFGNVAIVLQAKSKQLTIAGRQGSDEHLRADFEKAVQASCDQGYSCATLLLSSECTLKEKSGAEIAFPANIKKIYVMCVVADHYPALSFQSRQFLKFKSLEKISPPFVMDVFLLDAMTEMLASPLHLLSYIDRRTHYDDKIMSSHELNILGYHLKQNLWVGDKNNFVMIHDDVGTELDLSMLVRRENLPGKWTPEGILTRFDTTTLGRLIKEIERRPDSATIDFGFMILTLNEKTVVDLSNAIDELARRARLDSKSHDITVPIPGGETGLTIHCNFDSIEIGSERLGSHCAMRKYTEKVDSWFGICIDPKDTTLRFGVNLNFKWERDETLDEVTAGMPRPTKFTNLGKLLKAPKIGRNDPCPCGSGKKSKKCCYS